MEISALFERYDIHELKERLFPVRAFLNEEIHRFHSGTESSTGGPTFRPLAPDDEAF